VFILGDVLITVIWLVKQVLWLYMWVIIIRAVISWVNPDPWNPIVRFMYQVTEPVLRPIRRRLPATGIDFSPLIVIAVIIFLDRVLTRLELAALRLG
jgi:YggT family protein